MVMNNNNVEEVIYEAQEMMKVIIFSSNSGTKTIDVSINPTRGELEKAMSEQTDIDTRNLAWQDGLALTDLSNSNSILSNKGGKGMLYLTPKNNKAGMRTFKELRGFANTVAGFKDYVIANTQRFAKDNWTRLSSTELDLLYNSFIENADSPLVEAPVVVIQEEEVVVAPIIPAEMYEKEEQFIPDIDFSTLSGVDYDLDAVRRELAEIKSMVAGLPKTILAITNNINETAFNKAVRELENKRR
jgi:hypothetical protein